MTRRFYIEPAALNGDAVELPRELAQRLARVLRLQPGAEVVLFDGSGDDVRVRIDALDERAGRATVIERAPGVPEPRTSVHLYQSIAKGERFEWLLEKATELGVARFVPLITERSVVRTPGEGARIDRWRRIVVEAAEQCGRACLPPVEAPQPFAKALAGAAGILLLPYEAAGGEAPDIQHALDADIDALFALGEVSIFIGPEGGFTEEEVTSAVDAGATVVTLGRRVLRSETAGLVASTLVLQATGELG